MENSMKSDSNPLFEIKLELAGDKILFSPTIEPDDESNFQKMIQNLIDDIYKMGHHIPRVSDGRFELLNSSFYIFFSLLLGRETVSDLVGLLYLVDFIKNLLEEGVEEASLFVIEYQQYKYLWMEDKQEKLAEILVEFEEKKNAFLMLEKCKGEVSIGGNDGMG